MRFVTERDLRDKFNSENFTTYVVKEGEKLTPGARQFLLDFKIDFECGSKKKKLEKIVKRSDHSDYLSVYLEDIVRLIKKKNLCLLMNVGRFNRAKAEEIRQADERFRLRSQAPSMGQDELSLEEDFRYDDRFDHNSIYAVVQMETFKWDSDLLEISHKMYFEYLDLKNSEEEMAQKMKNILLGIKDLRSSVFETMDPYFEKDRDKRGGASV